MELFRSFGEKIAYHKQRSNRIEGLADAVFAIVMTLLVLDIRIPSVLINNEQNMLIFVSAIFPKILTFILSFVVTGQLWLVFTNQFNYIRDADRNEIIIAIFYLLFVSLIPFSTSFLSEHLWSRVAIGFYVLNILIALMLLTVHWIYAYHYCLVQMQESQKSIIHKAIMRRAKTVFLGYMIAALCCVINSYIALCVIVMLQALFTFVGFIDMLDTAVSKRLKSFIENNF